ncbi:MAG: hypothetical protein EPO24_01310 [Bacteroidetes bacterium]|nr:MAG: hypothetical protein EPO24_01310 [Bacteroidota bacterium]
MRKEDSKLIVIDSDITRASSERNNIRAMQSRKLLETVLVVCHKFLLTPEILNEWKDNRSGYSSSWLTKMMARRKSPPKESPEDATLRAKVKKLLDNTNELEPVLKDIHLIEGALSYDKIVISFEKEAHSNFKRISDSIGEFKPIMWLTLSDDFDDIIQWLEDGAPEKKEFQLGYKNENT